MPKGCEFERGNRRKLDDVRDMSRHFALCNGLEPMCDGWFRPIEHVIFAYYYYYYYQYLC
jgi:hypothetical protein